MNKDAATNRDVMHTMEVQAMPRCFSINSKSRLNMVSNSLKWLSFLLGRKQLRAKQEILKLLCILLDSNLGIHVLFRKAPVLNVTERAAGISPANCDVHSHDRLPSFLAALGL